jgi:hypothetical protein
VVLTRATGGTPKEIKSRQRFQLTRNPLGVYRFHIDALPVRAAPGVLTCKEEGVRSRISIRSLALVALALVVALLPGIASAQAIIKVNDNVSFRLGILLQGWADWNGQSDAAGNTAGFQQNLFLRRARFFLGGQVAKDVSFFFMTDNPNLGKSTQTLTSGTTGVKAPGTGFIIQDAYLEWKIANEFMIQGGLILIPLCRNCNSSAASLLSIDYGTWSFQESASTQSSVGRDTGFQAKGYLAGDHLEYRAGVYSGFRAPGVKNSFRFTGRAQYNVFDVEKLQFYPGTYFGKKKILSIGGGIDAQSDYTAYAGDVFFDWPVGKGDGITAQVDYIHYDGGVTFATAALFKQDDLFAEAGYFVGALKIQPFIRYEQQRYADDVNTKLNKTFYQAGFGWYPYGSNFNIKAAYWRKEFPNDPLTASTNQYTLQVQLFYY